MKVFNGIGLVCLGIMIVLLAATKAAEAPEKVAGKSEKQKPLLQVAILLDTSGSMSGLIEQAKIELWDIVNHFATVKKDGRVPELQVALYEYGKSSISADEGFMRMIVPLSTDLDLISKELFALTTNGGSEYCGMVIQQATENLQWSGDAGDYKSIVIAGNEPFTQGPVDYKKACGAAIGKGIVVNTIHCGGEQAGVQGKWKHGALLAEGSFNVINHNEKVVHVAAPQDEAILELNTKLNETYVPYGDKGADRVETQVQQDVEAKKLNKAGIVGRAMSKSSVHYRNANWDLVDAVREKEVKLEKMDERAFPEAMQNMTEAERKAYIKKQQEKRAELQSKIRKLKKERAAYVKAKRKEMQGDQGKESTLGAVLTQALSVQVEAAGFSISD